MAQIGRISSNQQFQNTKGHVLSNQAQLIKDTTKLNTDKRLLSNYESPLETNRIQTLSSLITKDVQEAKTKELAISELELAESSLVSIKDILDQIKETAVQGGSDTLSQEDREALADQLRVQGETLIQLANVKVGDKHLFSGIESDVETLTLNPDDAFNTAVYKGGAGETGERLVGRFQSSVSLGAVFNTPPQSASVTGTVNTPVSTGDIVLIIDDGNGNIINTGDINLAADNIAATVAKINAAFTAAGGAGTIAQQNPPGFLNLDTALVTGGLDNANAKITVNAGTTPGTALNDLGLRAGTVTGQSGDILEVLSALETAYKSNNSQAIREVLVDLDQNIERAIDSRSRLGDLMSTREESLTNNRDRQSELAIEKSSLEDIPIAEAINKVSIAQATLNNALNMATSIFQQSVFNFLNF